jgi:hypothetical protein
MELKANLSILDKACEDVKQSVRLKKVFRTILVVGNQMNDADKVLLLFYCALMCRPHALSV